MAKRSLAPVLAGLLAMGVPLAAQAPPKEDLPITLNCKPPSFKVRRPPVTFSGTCPLSSGIFLRVGLHRISEMLSAGELTTTVVDVGGYDPEIEDKKFTFSFPIDSPGKYMTKISIPIELQEQNHVAEIKKHTASKADWQFEFLVWGDDLVPLLATKLTELNALVAEVRDLLKRDEAACASEQTWAAQGKELTKEGGKLTNKLYTHELQAYFPAAMGNLYSTMKTVSSNAPYYMFGPDGKFAGAKDYHANNKKVTTFRGEDFGWDNLKRYCEDTIPCAGREFSLWMVKDLRRTAGQMRTEIQDAVKTQKAHPGVDLYAERLQKATIGDLDGLEADIRAKR